MRSRSSNAHSRKENTRAIFLLSVFLYVYNVSMKRSRTSKTVKSSNKKTKYKFDTKSNTIFEDNASPNVKVKFIYDKDEPFYKHTFTTEGK